MKMPLIRSANFNLFIEIFIRIILFTSFCYLETLPAFVRVIHLSEMEYDCKYPRRESYVPSETLWCIVLTVPCILTLLAWAVWNDCNDAFEILLAWSLALGIAGVITDSVKLIAGRPRPDFFYRCFPDGIATESMQCTGDPQDVMEGRKSFPSGHSSLSFCSLGIASIWICGRLGVLSRKRGSGLRVMVCLSPLILAMCVALSRSCDYHHHWQDITVGSILGFSVALFCYRQYYNPLCSDHAGIPYIVSNCTKYVNGKPDSPTKDTKEFESSPLLEGVKKNEKWF